MLSSASNGCLFNKGGSLLGGCQKFHDLKIGLSKLVQNEMFTPWIGQNQHFDRFDALKLIKMVELAKITIFTIFKRLFRFRALYVVIIFLVKFVHLVKNDDVSFRH